MPFIPKDSSPKLDFDRDIYQWIWMNTGRTSCTVAFPGRNKAANLNFVISNSEPQVAGMSIPADSSALGA